MPMIPFTQKRSDRYATVDLVIGTTVVPTYEYLESFTFSYGVNSDWTGTITLFDQQWDVIEGLVIEAQSANKGSPEGEIKFRFGWNNTLAPAGGWFRSNVISYAPTFSHDGVTLELNLSHPVSTTVNSEIWTGSWPAYTPPSEIVRSIAEKMKKRGKIKGWLIEPTRQTAAEVLVMNRQHPINWIKKTFCGLNPDKAAISSLSGESGFIVTVDEDDVLHFHTQGYLQTGVQRRYIFAKDEMGQVISFTPGDLSKFCQIMGGGAAGGTSVDTRGKYETRVGASPDGRVGTDAKKSRGDAPYIPVNTSRNLRLQRCEPYSSRVSGQMKERLDSRYQQLRDSQYTAELEVLGDPFLQYNTYIEVGARKRNGQFHYTSGVYLIKSVEHEISGGEFTSKLELQKSTAFKGEALPSGSILPVFDMSEAQRQRFLKNRSRAFRSRSGSLLAKAREIVEERL